MKYMDAKEFSALCWRRSDKRGLRCWSLFRCPCTAPFLERRCFFQAGGEAAGELVSLNARYHPAAGRKVLPGSSDAAVFIADLHRRRAAHINRLPESDCWNLLWGVPEASGAWLNFAHHRPFPMQVLLSLRRAEGVLFTTPDVLSGEAGVDGLSMTTNADN